MRSQVSINLAIYIYFKQNPKMMESLNDHTISIDEQLELVKFECQDTALSLSVFSTLNNMRYTDYTVDRLMGMLITMFGYESEVHELVHMVIKSNRFATIAY